MSKATKRKHVAKELQEDSMEIPSGNQSVVRLIDSRGNNLHEIVDSKGENYLVSMPVKFRRNVWVKRGDFVLVEPIPEGDKVKAEIVKILTKQHIKFYKAQNCWPEDFDKRVTSEDSKVIDRENKKESSEDEEDNLFINTNRRRNIQDSSGSPSESESD